MDIELSELKRNIHSGHPCALYSGSALDSKRNKHLPFPQRLPGAVLEPGYQVRRGFCPEDPPGWQAEDGT